MPCCGTEAIHLCCLESLGYVTSHASSVGGPVDYSVSDTTKNQNCVAMSPVGNRCSITGNERWQGDRVDDSIEFEESPLEIHRKAAVKKRQKRKQTHPGCKLMRAQGLMLHYFCWEHCVLLDDYRGCNIPGVSLELYLSCQRVGAVMLKL
jgi:hypothetical protein